MSKNQYKRIRDVQKDVDALYTTGLVKGAEIGFKCVSDFYSIKLGATTYVMASPTGGKTEFWFEVLINLSESKGWKHVIYSPETGSVAEIVAELISKYLKKPFYNYENRLTEQEKYKALAWLDEYFYIIDPVDEAMTPEQFFEEVDRIEKDLGVKIHTTTIDPYNELKNNHEKFGGRQDLYVEEFLGFVRRNARQFNRHNCIITHAADQQLTTSNGVSFYPPPTARQYSGGQAWFRKGLGMIALWRPPYGLNDDNGIPYEENEVHIIIQKAKPKGIGKKGVVKLYFDINKNRYYEKDSFGNIMYANEKKRETVLTPNFNFNDNEEKPPF